jgi:hypothetical protein
MAGILMCINTASLAETLKMFEIHASNWPVAIDPNDPRNHFHRTALAEARIATDLNQAAQPRRRSLVERVRRTLAGPASGGVEPCSCPA